MFSYPDLDLKISISLLVISFVIGLVTWAVSKKWKLGLIVFSILGNLSFLINVGSFMYISYSLKWLQYFSLFFWPLINIALVIIYRKQKNEERSN
ncbi:MAG TPA: hypothetical protein P5232_04770 [Candidatus Moranbacteria bacterium]|nr:hypothetical protein [Candidatus Moranbacteria bacterium]